MPSMIPGIDTPPPNQSSSGQSQSPSIVKKAVNTAKDPPAWIIVGLGATGYLLSETRILGPMLAVLLLIATLFQLSQKATHLQDIITGSSQRSQGAQGVA